MVKQKLSWQMEESDGYKIGNATNDPEEFFYYVMFSWGNCQAGDRLVLEEKSLEAAV